MGVEWVDFIYLSHSHRPVVCVDGPGLLLVPTTITPILWTDGNEVRTGPDKDLPIPTPSTTQCDELGLSSCSFLVRI